MRRGDTRVGGVMLAAGASRRMGSPKQLLAVGGTTLLERCVRAALLSRLDQVILVLGHEAQRIETALGPLARDSKLGIIYNDRYEKVCLLKTDQYDGRDVDSPEDLEQLKRDIR